MPSAIPDQRIRPRVSLRLRVDARLVHGFERDAILAGQGYAELDLDSLSLSRPRHGLKRSESQDVSTSGLRLKVDGIADVATGASLCLDVHLPKDRRVVKILGEVMWVGQRDGEPVAGVRMAALDVEGLRRLSGVLA